MLGFLVGLVAANAGEWVVHKYVLHGLGRRKHSYWSFHWHEHHRMVRRTGGVDPMYKKPFWRAQAKRREVVGLLTNALSVAPLLPIAPGFVGAVWLSSGAYYYVHRRAHLDPAWARRWVPWHYDHHMGPRQHANWCVTFPLWDWVMGTREPFAGTEAERKATRGKGGEAEAQPARA
jgi:sterol desaturase/sphingolipid hydroxylase (fatty acid hydroxylase superfamily)